MRTLSAHFNAAIIAAALSIPGNLRAEGLTDTKRFYADDPIWTSPKPAPARTAGRKLNEYYDFLSNTFFPPGERAPHTGSLLPSQAINTVDEVPDSAWYTNRHAARRLSIGELQAGTGNSRPPAPGTWKVVAAKNEGITPGFRIQDSAGRQYLVKFDPLSNPELASAADVITSKFFYALGYNVPENYVVYFDRSRVEVGKNAMVKDAEGRKRPIRAADIDEMLAKAPRRPDGTYRAMASLVIPGRPVGPFQYHGTRGDDPNDLVEHEHRRDLRALRTFCAWLGHDDSKALNSLDMLVEEDGVPYVKHYLIDFGASLGSASFMANSPRDGNVYLFDWKSSATQFLTLGLYAPKWQRAQYPAIPSAGRFEYEVFDPMHWVGDYPSTAFRNENSADRAWAARKINAFTNEEIRAIVSTGQYSDPAAEEWISRCLIERRNKIVNAFLTGTAGLDRFEVVGDQLEAVYVGPASAAPPVKVRWATFDNETGQKEFLAGATSQTLPNVPASVEYLLAEIESSNGPAISVYIRVAADRNRVVGVERHFAASRKWVPYMRIQPVSSDALQTPKPLASQLPPQILDRATDGLCWMSLISAVSAVALTMINHILQPEVAAAWNRPMLRLFMLGVFFLSVGFIVVQRQGWLSKPRLLDAGMVFQILIAFACGLFEGAAYKDPNATVFGHSRIAVWMILCGRLMPNAPLKSAFTGAMCVLMWPLAYWVDLRIYGYEPMPLSRMLVWVLPLIILAVWMYALNNRVLSYYVQQQRADDIGSYVLTSRLGKGGMGEVWRARHKTLARDAAVKLIRPEMLTSSTGRQEVLLKRRFEREAQVTASLRSPHTVALYDYGQSKDGAFYYVMELLDGIDLQTMVERFGPLDPSRVVHILRQVAQSLEEAHRAGLVHRDIKPRNILVAKMGMEYDFAKVLDFGLVKLLHEADTDRTLTTIDGATTGTPAYLSPEAALGRPVDARSDLYSLGCTAYYLLTGKMVFDEPTPTSFAIAHVQKKPQPMSERSELPIPAGLETIVMQLLEKDPANRMPSAYELGRRLRALRESSEWSPDRAERWWETNLPDLALRRQIQEQFGMEETADLARA